MAGKKKVAEVAGLNMKALAAEIGATVKEGKVTAVRDKCFVTVGGTKKEVIAGDLIDLGELGKLVGKTVPIIISGRTIIAIGYPTKPWPCYVMCYFAPPDNLRRVLPDLRVALIQQYVKAGVIPDKLGKVLLTPIQLP